MNSIQQVAVEFVQKLLSLDITRGLSAFMEEGYKEFCEYFTQLAALRINEVDECIKDNPAIRKGWKVLRCGDSRTLLTEHGEVQYERRYYKNEKMSSYAYLADKVIGVENYERIERSLGAKICKVATEQSYETSSKECCKGKVSRQAVKNKTRRVHVKELKPEKQRTDVKILHIQADEDHVARQDGKKGAEVRLVAIHEPIQRIGKRTYLPNKYTMVSYQENPEDFWIRVANEISARYGDRGDLTVYLHGDGASWIKSGLEWIKNSKYVLDKYHLVKYMRPVCNVKTEYYDYLWDALKSNNYVRLKNLVECLINDEVCNEETGKAFLDYAKKNWEGIKIWFNDPESGSSCAEGLVSHTLSDRLSSRPKGWSDEGIRTISNLRVYIKNGGRIGEDDLRKQKESKGLTQMAFKVLKKKMLGFEPMPSEALKVTKRGTNLYWTLQALRSGGMVI